MTAPVPPASVALPRLVPVADHAVLVEFAEAIGDAAHAAVLALDRALAATPPPGLREVVPAYVSLLVVFDPLLTDHAGVSAALRGLLAGQVAQAPAGGAEHWVDVCHDADLAPDLAEVSRQTGLSAEAVIAAHLAGDYRVFMYGFAPGYAYLGGVPAPLRLPRKTAPVRGVAAGSVLIAGPQCLISTLVMPTGWWVIGRTALRVLTGDPANPFLFGVGDRLRFRRIDRAGYERACAAAGRPDG